MSKTKIALAAVGVAAVAAAGSTLLAPKATAQMGGSMMMMAANNMGQVWDAFGGNQQAQKYSTATQITPDNVKNLKVAWSIHTGDVASGAHTTTWGATPLFVNNTVYVGTPFYRIFAVEPDTGKTKWVYSASGHNGQPSGDAQKILLRTSRSVRGSFHPRSASASAVA